MKRTVRKWLGAVGFAMLSAWSAAGFAQTVSCSGTICSYGPICPDGWGGCYFYTWSIGSAVNTWTEKAGIANIVRLCDANNLTNCVFVKSEVTLTQGDGPNALIVCKVPGGNTCTDGECGGSPGSSGAVFINTTFSQSVIAPVPSTACTKDDKDKGGVKCTKTNTLQGLVGDADAAALYCPNKQWAITEWIPLNFIGTTTATGPKSRQDPSLITSFAQAQCWLLDPQGRKPNEPGYALSSNLSENQLDCIHREEGVL